MMRKLKLITAVLTMGLIWVLWPIYGFLSNQYETARLPWGWHELPQAIPQSQIINDAAYKSAGNEAMRLLLKRRGVIAAPSLSAAVSVDGHLVWAGTVGWANISDNKAATPQTAYRIGSTSKAVTATALAKLSANGRIDINEPISDYMKEIPNREWERFTSRELASHTAGLAGYEENNDWIGFYHSLALRKRYKNATDSLSLIDGAKTLFKPSQNFHYSGFHNVLLSAVMESVEKQSFSDVVEGEVSAPLMLTSLRPDYQTNVTHDTALSYQVKGQTYKPWRKVDLSHKLAAGGFVATPSDLAVLGGAWLDDDFIPEVTRRKFWTPVKINGKVNVQDYALGFRRKSWPISGAGDVEHLNHGGVSKGAQCWLMIIPDYNMSIAISTNRRTSSFFDFGDVYVDILAIFIEASRKVEQSNGFYRD